MRYRTKPFEIEAFQYHGLHDLDALRKAFPDIELTSTVDGMRVWDHLQITWVLINKGDYVIKGMKGEYYPCEPEVFEAKYEEINERV